MPLYIDILEDSLHVSRHSGCEDAQAFVYVFFESSAMPSAHFLYLLVAVTAESKGVCVCLILRLLAVVF